MPGRHRHPHDPEAGKTLKPGTAVDLIVSKGRQPIKVKDWTGKDADEATEALTEKGLVVEVVGEAYDDDVPEGDVLTQTPTSGTAVPRRDGRADGVPGPRAGRRARRPGRHGCRRGDRTADRRSASW